MRGLLCFKFASAACFGYQRVVRMCVLQSAVYLARQCWCTRRNMLSVHGALERFVSHTSARIHVRNGRPWVAQRRKSLSCCAGAQSRYLPFSSAGKSKVWPARPELSVSTNIALATSALASRQQATWCTRRNTPNLNKRTCYTRTRIHTRSSTHMTQPTHNTQPTACNSL